MAECVREKAEKEGELVEWAPEEEHETSRNLFPLQRSPLLVFFFVEASERYTAAPKWSSSDKSKLKWSRGVREFAGINLTRTPRQSSLLYAEPVPRSHWSPCAGNSCQPMQTPSGWSRAASLRRFCIGGSGRKGSLSSNVQPSGEDCIHHRRNAQGWQRRVTHVFSSKLNPSHFIHSGHTNTSVGFTWSSINLTWIIKREIYCTIHCSEGPWYSCVITFLRMGCGGACGVWCTLYLNSIVLHSAVNLRARMGEWFMLPKGIWKMICGRYTVPPWLNRFHANPIKIWNFPLATIFFETVLFRHDTIFYPNGFISLHFDSEWWWGSRVIEWLGDQSRRRRAHGQPESIFFIGRCESIKHGPRVIDTSVDRCAPRLWAISTGFQRRALSQHVLRSFLCKFRRNRLYARKTSLVKS